MQPDVSFNRLADVFAAASSDVEKHGWKAGRVNAPSEWDKNGTYERCIWIAVIRAAERMFPAIWQLDRYYQLAENALLNHFGFHQPIELFTLNDEDGSKEWCVEHLRAIEKTLRGADAQTLVEAPDII